MARLFVAVALLCAVSTSVSAQTLTLTTSPAKAELYRTGPAGNRIPIGTGTAQFKIEKNQPNEVWVTAEGYLPQTWRFSREEKYPKTGVLLELKTRVVKVTSAPFDAQIFVNGVASGTQAAEIKVEENKPVTVELRKPGWAAKSRTYRNQAGAEVPPLTENIELTDRKVLVTAVPSGALIFADDAQLGETSAEVVVPRGKCVNAKATRSGYAPVERLYCNRDTTPEPPLNDSFTLRDRMTAVNATPKEAIIFLNGRRAGAGDFQVTIPQGQCIDMHVQLDGYVRQTKNYCNQQNMPVPPQEEHVQLVLDEAYTRSIKSDQANVNFTIAVNPAKTTDDAWKLMSQIVLSLFDVLEITDKETGYLRTAWEPFAYPFSSVRTRLIVKLGDTNPLKYVVKLQTEYAPKAVSVKSDEDFMEWDRIPAKYKDLINELQSRLQ